MDRRTLAPDQPEQVEFGERLVEDTIPGHEFPRPVDSVLQAGGTILSGSSAEVFSSSTFIMVGPIPVQFGECVTLYAIRWGHFTVGASLIKTPEMRAPQ